MATKCHNVPLHRMTQQQRDILVGVTNQMMEKNWSTLRFEQEVDRAFEAAGCPCTPEQQETRK